MATVLTQGTIITTNTECLTRVITRTIKIVMEMAEAGTTVVVVAGQTITRAVVVVADLAAVTIVTLAGAGVVVAAEVVLLTHMMMIEGTDVEVIVVVVEIATTVVLHLLIATEVGDVEIDPGRAQDHVIVMIVEEMAEIDTAVAGGGHAQDPLHLVMAEAATVAGIVVIMTVHPGILNILVRAVEIFMDLSVVQSFLNILSSHLSYNIPTA